DDRNHTLRQIEAVHERERMTLVLVLVKRPHCGDVEPAIYKSMNEMEGHSGVTGIVSVLLVLEPAHLRLLVPSISWHFLAHRIANRFAIVNDYRRHQVIVEQFMLIVAADDQNIELSG